MSDTGKTGSCLCGGVSYVVTGPLRQVVACHCHQCQKTSGHYVAATEAALVDVKINEETLIWYQSSDAAERGFCRRCGGNLFWRRMTGGRISIFAGTLDGPTDLRLTAQIHTEDRADYYNLPAVSIIDQAELG